LDMFELDYNMTLYDLNRAKKMVLMLHPDKSKLPAEYFLFYKHAFDKIIELYDDLTKHNRPITKESTIYNSNVSMRDISDHAPKTTAAAIKRETESRNFNEKFNQMFERAHQTRPDESRNDWFRKETADYDTLNVTTRENMARQIEVLREKTAAANSLTQYRGFKEVAPGFGTTLYEDSSQKYVSAPIFQERKLVFDDIRKVHKDETIIPVKYVDAPSRTMTVEQYLASRAPEDELPMAQEQAEFILADKRMKERTDILRKQHKAKVEAAENEKKSNRALASFFMLKNGAEK
jgi:hypothetical protein